MNTKTLLAVAVAGALAAPGFAMAQQAAASGTNVQIYGLFDIRVDTMKYSGATGAGTTTGVGNDLRKAHVATGAPNRIGFRGTEALGGGLSAFFQVESQVFTDAAPGNGNSMGAMVGGRPTFVGLRGGWGEVSIGYQDSVYWDVYNSTWQVGPTQPHYGIIMMNGSSSGAIPSPSCTTLTNAGTGAVATGALPTGTAPTGVASGTAAQGVPGVICGENEGNGTAFRRTMSNSLTYRSPVIAGFRFSTMTAVGDFKEPSNSTPVGASQYKPAFGAYSLTWSAGPLSLAGGYERHVGFRATNTAVTNRAAVDSGFQLGARFNYGMGLIGLGWERLKYGNAGTQATATGDDSFTQNNWTAQGTYNLTPADVLSLGYSKTPGRTDCGSSLNVAATGVPTAASTNQPGCGNAYGAKMWTLSLDHSFSKRTALYALYSRIDNNAAATYYYIAGPASNANNGSTGGLSAGTDVVTYQLGVKHSF
jgi:predicted porin